MDYSLITTKDSIIVVGVSRSITNVATAHVDVGELWHIFATKIDELKHTVDDKLYCIYTNYSPGGCYTCIIGKQVSTTRDIPDGMVSISIPANCYARYDINGEMPQAIVTFWGEFWSSEHDYKRAYTLDYEVYSESSETSAQIYIARAC